MRSLILLFGVLNGSVLRLSYVDPSNGVLHSWNIIEYLTSIFPKLTGETDYDTETEDENRIYTLPGVVDKFECMDVGLRCAVYSGYCYLNTIQALCPGTCQVGDCEYGTEYDEYDEYSEETDLTLFGFKVLMSRALEMPEGSGTLLNSESSGDENHGDSEIYPEEINSDFLTLLKYYFKQLFARINFIIY